MSLSDKQFIINIAKDEEKVGAKANLTKLGQKFNVHRTTIGKILKSREDFKASIHDEAQSPTSKMKRSFKFDDVDKASTYG